jgi:toxin YoeB
MRVVFTEESWEDYTYWQATDRKILKRINRLIDDIARDNDGGIGKPELLMHSFPQGTMSRRIDQEHRLVYLVRGADIVVLQARYHYG